MEVIYRMPAHMKPNYNIEPGEELRSEFEAEYGKNKKRKDKDDKDYGQWLDLSRLPNGDYRSMVTFYAWAAFRHGRGVYNPNTDNKINS